MDSNNLVIIGDPRLGSVEEFNILNPKIRRKKLKSNYIQNNITSIIILISLIFTFLALSDIIPIFNFQAENKVHIQENKESKTKDKELTTNIIAESSSTNSSKESQSCNGNIGLNQNYEKIDANDSKYTYIPIVGIDDIHGNFFPKTNNIIVNKYGN